jgi:hypothetical protein
MQARADEEAQDWDTFGPKKIWKPTLFINAPFLLPKGRQLVVYLARMVLFFGLKQQR